VRDRQEYIKPSIKRAKAKKAGRARWLKKQAKLDSDMITTSGNKRKR
jgi:ribosomal protein S21